MPGQGGRSAATPGQRLPGGSGVTAAQGKSHSWENVPGADGDIPLAVRGGGCSPRSHSALTFPYGSRRAAPGPGPARNYSELLLLGVPFTANWNGTLFHGPFPAASSSS